jgi:hypothetical protein
MGKDLLRWWGVEFAAVREEMELIAAFFSAWRELVKLDLKLGFGFGVFDRSAFDIDRSRSSSGSSCLGTSGWSEAHSSDLGNDFAFSFLRFWMDFRLHRDSGVDRLSLDNMDLSSASSDGTESADTERVYRKLSSGILSAGVGHGSWPPSGSSNNIPNAELPV